MKLSGTLAEKGLHAFDQESRKHQGHYIPQTWIVVADSTQAHIYRRSANGFERIADARMGYAHGIHETAAGNAFYGRDAKSQLLTRGDGAFIAHLAEWLDKAEDEHVFDRLVLVAPPRTLGDLRVALGKNAFSRVTAQVDKDLTRMPEATVMKRLNEIHWF